MAGRLSCLKGARAAASGGSNGPVRKRVQWADALCQRGRAGSVLAAKVPWHGMRVGSREMDAAMSMPGETVALGHGTFEMGADLRRVGSGGVRWATDV